MVTYVTKFHPNFEKFSVEFHLIEFSRVRKSNAQKLSDGKFMEKERLRQKKYYVPVAKLSKADNKRERNQ